MIAMLSALLSLGLAGCKDHNSPGDPVDEGDLLGLVISPDGAIVPVGEQVQFHATGLLEDRETLDLTTFVNWSTSDEEVVWVSNEEGRQGLLSAGSVGTAQVSAFYGSVQAGAVSVFVTDADISALSVRPEAVSIEVGDTVQLTATAEFSNGSSADATNQVHWLTGDGSVASVSSAGVVQGQSAGDTIIYAEWSGVESRSVDVEVVGGGGSSSGPDLRIASMDLYDGGGVLLGSVVVENAGDVGASEFFVDVFVDPTSTPGIGDYGDAFSLVDYVGPGDTTTVSINLDIADGAHDVYALVDSTDAIEESSESNNGDSQQVTIGGGGGSIGANLEITYFSWLSDSTDVYYYVDITNTGSEDVDETFYVDLFVDRSYAPGLYADGDEWTYVYGLGAGETTYADFLAEGVDCGTSSPCTSWVMLDGYDYVDETDETDNVEGPEYVYLETR